MLIEIKEVFVFNKIIDHLKNLVDNVIFEFTENGLKICSMDKNNTMFIDMYVKCEFFTIYDLKSDILDIGINLISFYKILKLASMGDIIQIEHDENDEEITNIQISIISKLKTISNYSLKCLLLEKSVYESNLEEASQSLTVSTDNFTKSVNCIGLINGHDSNEIIKIVFNVNNLSILSNSQTQGIRCKINIKCTKDEDVLFEDVEKKNNERKIKTQTSERLFSQKVLLKMVKNINIIAEKLNLSIDDNGILFFNLLNIKNIYYKITIAPLIIDEESCEY